MSAAAEINDNPVDVLAGHLLGGLDHGPDGRFRQIKIDHRPLAHARRYLMTDANNAGLLNPVRSPFAVGACDQTTYLGGPHIQCRHQTRSNTRM